MTNTPKPTPPRLTLPDLPRLPDVAPDLTGHIDAALFLLARADRHATDAIACRMLDDHQRAGQFRERERMCLKRADLLVEISKAEALDHIAQRLDRIALGL